jgi:phosphotransferase system enzyme I (PtsI)
MDDKGKNLALKGIGASVGIAIGKAYVLEREEDQVIEKRNLHPDEVDGEITRFKTAVQQAQEHLRKVIQEIPEEYKDQAYILDAHMMILRDRTVYDETIEQIRLRRMNAEQALKKTTDKVISNFRKMPDPYFQERKADIIHVTNLIFKNLLGTAHGRMSDIDQRVIIVAQDMSPVETTQIQLERVKAFITETGSPTSHTGIIARSLEIPAILGVEKATDLIETGDLIIVDGSAGVVIVDPDEETLTDYLERKVQLEAFQAQITRTSHLPAETTDGHRVFVNANITVLEEVVSVIDHGADGIGLYRTEFLYLNESRLPTEADLCENYKELVELMGQREVTIRTLDIGGDKFASSIQWADEINPALGVRAIRFCLQSPEIFKVQLRAILQAARFGNVRVMFPMVAQVEEIVQAKRMLDEAAESLEKDGLPYKRDIAVGAMMEVPSAVVMADAFAKEVDFFSLGTNDLIQYSFAIDRINKHVANLYQPLHPSVLRMIRQVVEAGQQIGIPVALCGEMGGDVISLPVLLGLEVDSISMNPVSVPAIKETIRQLSFQDAKVLAREALKESTASRVDALIREACGDALQTAAFFQANGL